MKKNINCLNDIYYQNEYGYLYTTKESEIIRFDYKKEDKFFTNVLLKKNIKKIGNFYLEKPLFDAETPYGYGGICTNIIDQSELVQVLAKYEDFCRSEKIINEFIRFHPFLSTLDSLNEFLTFSSELGNVVTINTKLNEEERWASYSAKTRNILRRCKNELILREREDVNDFHDLYEKTMLKNNAADFYFFEKSYFEKLIQIDAVKLYEVLYDNHIVSSGFFMFSEDYVHYHLSANNYDFSKKNGNYFLLDSVAQIAHEKGISKFLLGGGRTNDEQDSLLKFKKKFSNIVQPFNIGGKIYDADAHQYCIDIWENENPEKNLNYFQKYRI